MFLGRSEFIEINSFEFDFNKVSKKDEIDSEFSSYNKIFLINYLLTIYLVLKLYN